MDIGTKIKNAREDKDLLQRDMAELIPMNQSNYSKIERNIQEPDMHQLKRIAEILDIDLNRLFGLKISEDSQSKSNENDIRFAEEVKELCKKYYLNQNKD